MTRKKQPVPIHKPQRRGPRMVDAVLQATLSELARVGFARLSVEEVADIAGVNKTSVYRRWATKAELVKAALSNSLSFMRDFPDSGGLRSDLVVFVGLAARYLETPQGMGAFRVLASEGSNPDLMHMATQMLAAEETAGALAIIQRAVNRGELSASTNTQLILFTLMGALFHRFLVEQAPANSAWVEELVDLILNGAVAAVRRKPVKRK